ncbi:MAG: ATP-binding protein [Ferruginibacter sp.]
MYLETILAIIIIRFLRKTLQTSGLLSQWDRILLGGIAVSIGLLVAEVAFHESRPVVGWLGHTLLLYLAYIIFYKKEFQPAKPMMYGMLPYLAVSLLDDLVKLASPGFYNQWHNYFGTAQLFAFIWMVAMWLITKKQRTALEKERLRTEEKEKQNQVTESLKAVLEVQVADRTAELTLQKEELQHALDELKATQVQLIQSEKMASLGELTAGIAHEIQNPLNFVNNFSEINSELIEEMKIELNSGNNGEAIAIANDIAANEQKINHHGKRADAIVKGMLHHSRSSDGVKEPTDINALADEYLRLAYHGLRAKDKSFNATMKTDFDPAAGNINIISQDIGRVILNLITNAFYTVAEKKKKMLQPNTSASGEINRENLFPAGDYEPTVFVSTKKVNGKLEITVKDNGNGIPQQVVDKIFQPFFTTKPTGQGTGLGLSLSYDIIKGHGGEIKVETNEGVGSAFIIRLPFSDDAKRKVVN